MSEAHLFALGIALAWIAGIRAYLTVFGAGLAGLLGWLELPGELALCANPWVLGTAGILTAVEFATDKIPGVDSGWDLLQTVVRIPVGAFLAGAALGDPDTGLSTLGMVSGAGAALSAHALKAGTRALINVSPEPVSNVLASGGEDGLALGSLMFVFANPWLVLVIVVTGSVLMFASVYWLLRRVLPRRAH